MKDWFGTVTGDVALDPSLSPTACRVYLVLVMFRNRETGECFPTNATIERHSGLSRATVKRALTELAEAGVIRRVPQYRDGRQVASLTVLTDAKGERWG